MELTEEDGVHRPGAVSLDNLGLVARSRLVSLVGGASPGTLHAICPAAAEAIGCAAP